jgi:hypothetical protein
MWRQSGRRSTRTQYEMGCTVKAVARYWAKCGPAVMRELDQITRRLHTEPIGLTSRNRAMLRPFDDPANVRLFISLPGKLAAQASRAD